MATTNRDIIISTLEYVNKNFEHNKSIKRPAFSYDPDFFELALKMKELDDKQPAQGGEYLTKLIVTLANLPNMESQEEVQKPGKIYTLNLWRDGNQEQNELIDIIDAAWSSLYTAADAWQEAGAPDNPHILFTINEYYFKKALSHFIYRNGLETRAGFTNTHRLEQDAHNADQLNLIAEANQKAHIAQLYHEWQALTDATEKEKKLTQLQAAWEEAEKKRKKLHAITNGVINCAAFAFTLLISFTEGLIAAVCLAPFLPAYAVAGGTGSMLTGAFIMNFMLFFNDVKSLLHELFTTRLTIDGKRVRGLFYHNGFEISLKRKIATVSALLFAMASGAASGGMSIFALSAGILGLAFPPAAIFIIGVITALAITALMYRTIAGVIKDTELGKKIHKFWSENFVELWSGDKKNHLLLARNVILALCLPVTLILFNFMPASMMFASYIPKLLGNVSPAIIVAATVLLGTVESWFRAKALINLGYALPAIGNALKNFANGIVDLAISLVDGTAWKNISAVQFNKEFFVNSGLKIFTVLIGVCLTINTIGQFFVQFITGLSPIKGTAANAATASSCALTSCAANGNAAAELYSEIKQDANTPPKAPRLNKEWSNSLFNGAKLTINTDGVSSDNETTPLLRASA